MEMWFLFRQLFTTIPLLSDTSMTVPATPYHFLMAAGPEKGLGYFEDPVVPFLNRLFGSAPIAPLGRRTMQVWGPGGNSGNQ